MLLAEYWQISFAMLFNMACFVGLCLILSIKLYNIRKQERQLYKGKAFLTMQDVGHFWKKYKKTINETQVKMRENIWFTQFIFVILCLAVIYPTEFIYTFRQEFPEYRITFDHLIFYLFWAGVYHSPTELSGHGYFYNLYGYLLILMLLIFEKSAQKWALNRFGCNSEKIAWFKEIEKNLNGNSDLERKSIPEIN